MESTYLPISPAELLAHVHRTYGIRGTRIRLHRDSGGRVYYIECPEGQKVFKLYRPMHTRQAIQGARVMDYLDRCGFAVVRIIPTHSGSLHTCLDAPGGACVGILFDFARGKCIGFLHRWRDGGQPPVHPKATQIGRDVGRMHRLMADYDEPLMPKGKARYIDDLVALMRRDHYDEGKTRDLKAYGDALWAALKGLPQGFCHGDMHTGNTVYHGGLFTWMDFDRASHSYPVMDVGWLSDATDFNAFDEGGLERSMRLFDAVYAGYSQERILTDGEISAVLGCIAIVHYDLIADIVLRGGETLHMPFIDEQHGWLMRWRALCARRGL